MRYSSLTYANKLKDAGISDMAAEVIAQEQEDILNNIREQQLATKGDIYELRKDMLDTRETLKDMIHSTTWKTVSLISLTQGMFLTLFGLMQHYFMR